LANDPSPFKRMFYDYVLKSKKDQSHSIWFAVDGQDRMRQRRPGLVQLTKIIKQLILNYSESYISKTHELIREKQLKRLAKEFFLLKGRLKNSLMIVG